MKVEFDKDGWPLEIPWPEEGEFIRFNMRDESGHRSCLAGWARIAFWGDHFEDSLNGCHPSRPHEPAWTVYQAFCSAVRSRGFTSTIEFNNDDATTDTDRTALWREVWESFGYSEVEP